MEWNRVAKVPVFSRFFAAVEKFAGRAAAGHLILRRRTPGNFRQVAAGQLRSQVELLELWGRHPTRRLPWQDERLDYQRGKSRLPFRRIVVQALRSSRSHRGDGAWTNSNSPIQHHLSCILACGRRGGADHVRPHRLPRGPASFRQIE